MKYYGDSAAARARAARRSGQVKTRQCSAPWGDMRPADWLQQQLGVCWMPDRQTMEVIKAVLGPLLGCSSCARNGTCPLQQDIERAEREALR